jgi:hypothetical protein
MKLDRDLQHQILTMAAAAYPAPIHPNNFNPLIKPLDQQLLGANLLYLHQHGLLTKAVAVGADGHISLYCPAATAAGMDFLADDGGLSAILGVVTVKLHSDTIRDLIEARIANDPKLAEAEKSKLKEAIRNLPAKTFEQISTKAVEYGLTHGPDALHWILQHVHTV